MSLIIFDIASAGVEPIFDKLRKNNDAAEKDAIFNTLKDIVATHIHWLSIDWDMLNATLRNEKKTLREEELRSALGQLVADCAREM